MNALLSSDTQEALIASLLSDPDVVHTVSVSGGKDSSATYCTALELLGPRGFRAVAADTGNEHPATYDQVNNLHTWTGGPRVEWVRADFTDRIRAKRDYILAHWHKPRTREGITYPPVPADLIARAAEILDVRLANPAQANPYLDMCLWKGRFPSRKAQFCTEALKIEPIQAWQAQHMREGRTLVSWQGVRAAESFERSLLAPIQELNAETICGEPVAGRIFTYRPLLRVETIDEVFAISARHGVPRNPLYGWGLSRVGCFPCVNCSKSELALLHRHFPEQIERVERWEELVSAASRRGIGSFIPAVADPVTREQIAYHEALGEHLHLDTATYGIRRMVEWAQTSAGGRQYPLFDAAFEPAPTLTACNAHGVCE